MNPVQQLLTDHIGIWSVANNAKKSGRGRAAGNAGSVYGVKKLRELILELAVRGKLVPQDASDEPASEVLKRIQAEKAKLVAEGKIKKDKPLAAITDDEKPFELPPLWEWARFGAIYSLEYGNNLPAEKRSNSGEYPVYGSNGIVGSHNICFVKSACIVVGRKGSAGALNLSTSAGCCVTDVAYYCIPPICLDLVFSFKLFHSIGLDFLGKGIKPGLNRNEAYEILIAIPPFAEQHRIVAKVNEMMVLCDQMESQHTDAADAHENLVNHLLDTLTELQSFDDFDSNWQRIAANFDILFTTEASIDALKQTLLQLAVMGKLVPQVASDEPASELLKRIQVEKARLVAEGKIKKDKPFQPIKDVDTPFALPQSWNFVRKFEIFLFLNGYAFKSESFKSSGIKLLRNVNISHGVTKWNDSAHLSIDESENFKEFILSSGDIVLSLDRPIITTGLKYAVISDADIPCLLLQRVAKISSISNSVILKYMVIWLNSPFFIKNLDPGRSNGVPHISTTQLSNMIFSLPPVREQHRIVAKVDELMALCDQMKARINDAGQLQRKLADVLVEHAVA